MRCRFDGNIHDEQHRAIVALRSQIVSGTVNPWSDTPLGAMTHLVRGGSKRREEPESRVPAGHPLLVAAPISWTDFNTPQQPPSVNPENAVMTETFERP